ncbi:MAG: hypothetical protein AAFX53_17765 [Bacteroidota bacterium]
MAFCRGFVVLRGIRLFGLKITDQRIDGHKDPPLPLVSSKGGQV